MTKIQTDFNPVPSVADIIDLSLAYDATSLIQEAIGVVSKRNASELIQNFNKLFTDTLKYLKYNGITVRYIQNPEV